MGILKGIAKGLGYFLLFPILVIAISLYAVIGLFVFLFQVGKLIFLFFTGRNLFGDLPEDEEVKRLKKINAPKQEEESNNEDPSLSNNIVYGSGYTSPYVKDEEPTVLEEPKPEEGGENDDQ